MLWTALYRCWHIGCEMQLALPNARTTLNEKKKNSMHIWLKSGSPRETFSTLRFRRFYRSKSKGYNYLTNMSLIKSLYSEIV